MTCLGDQHALVTCDCQGDAEPLVDVRWASPQALAAPPVRFSECLLQGLVNIPAIDDDLLHIGHRKQEDHASPPPKAPGLHSPGVGLSRGGSQLVDLGLQQLRFAQIGRSPWPQRGVPSCRVDVVFWLLA